MFKNTYQSGLLSIFHSVGSDPLGIWETSVKNGHVKRLTDEEVNSLVLEIVGTNVATTYISCPRDKKVLGIRLPFLVMILKNMKRYFSFEITILDDKNVRRRFRISNFQSTTKIKPFCTTMPIGLSGGWNQVQFNLADFTRRAYGSQFVETLKVQIHANTRLRRIYFSDRLYAEDELPQDYKLYLPLASKGKMKKQPPPVPEKPAAPPSEAEAVPPELPIEVVMEPIKSPEKPASVKGSKTSVASAAKPPSVKTSIQDAPTIEETAEDREVEEGGGEGGAEVAEVVEGGEISESGDAAGGVPEESPEDAPAEAAPADEESPDAEKTEEDPPAEDAPASEEAQQIEAAPEEEGAPEDA